MKTAAGLEVGRELLNKQNLNNKKKKVQPPSEKKQQYDFTTSHCTKTAETTAFA